MKEFNKDDFNKIVAENKGTLDDLEVQIALKDIECMRCPLKMTRSNLHDTISEIVEDYCIDNDVDNSEILSDDIEELFWSLI